jgi:hypothetical protein
MTFFIFRHSQHNTVLRSLYLKNHHQFKSMERKEENVKETVDKTAVAKSFPWKSDVPTAPHHDPIMKGTVPCSVFTFPSPCQCTVRPMYYVRTYNYTAQSMYIHNYSLCWIVVMADLDISRHILCIDGTEWGGRIYSSTRCRYKCRGKI